MANDVKFEGKERRLAKIEKCLAEYGLSSLEEARDLCLSKGIDVDGIVKGVQPIAFDNASWAYTLGVAVALKKGVATASDTPKPAVRSMLRSLAESPAATVSSSGRSSRAHRSVRPTPLSMPPRTMS